jgi:hypothetical protein
VVNDIILQFWDQVDIPTVTRENIVNRIGTLYTTYKSLIKTKTSNKRPKTFDQKANQFQEGLNQVTVIQNWLHLGFLQINKCNFNTIEI